jgi:hypothetical protein
MVTMAIVNPDPVPLARRFRYGSFLERYPDYLSWLDGQQWILTVGEDIKEDPNTFRAALHYQCRALGGVLRTGLRRQPDGTVLMLVQNTQPGD